MSTQYGPYQEWSENRIIESFREFAYQHGRPPISAEWTAATGERPSRKTVFRAFGTWSAAVRAAGYEPLHPDRPPPRRRR